MISFEVDMKGSQVLHIWFGLIFGSVFGAVVFDLTGVTGFIVALVLLIVSPILLAMLPTKKSATVKI